MKNGVNKTNGEDIWVSGYAVPGARVIIDEKLQRVLRAVQEEKKGLEFSVLAKGNFKNAGFFIKGDYYVPKQEVSYASVDYLENLALKRKEGWNVVVHSHPDGVNDFSSADDETINTHFPCSVLLNSKGEPIKSVLNLEMKNGKKIKVEDVKTLVSYTLQTVPKEVLSRIKEKAHTNIYQYQYTHQLFPSPKRKKKRFTNAKYSGEEYPIKRW